MSSSSSCRGVTVDNVSSYSFGGTIMCGPLSTPSMTAQMIYSHNATIENLFVTGTIDAPSGGGGGGSSIVDQLTVTGNADSTSTDTGSIQTMGGVGISLNCCVGGSVTAAAGFVGSTMHLLYTTTSDEFNNGALVVNGGVGVAGNINLGGYCHVGDMTLSESPSTGSLIADGGVGVGGDCWVAGSINSGNQITSQTLNLKSTIESGTTKDGTLVVAGGVGISGNCNVGGMVNAVNGFSGSTIYLTDSGQSYAPTQGAFVVVGGVGIGGNVNIGGCCKISDVTPSISTDSGSLTIGGGLGVAGALFVGQNIQATSLHLTDTTGVTINTGGNAVIGNNTTSQTPYDGSLVVNGGIGANGNMRLSGQLNVSSSEPSYDTQTGSGVFAGGLAVAGNAHIGGTITASNFKNLAVPVTYTYAGGSLTNTLNVVAIGNFVQISQLEMMFTLTSASTITCSISLPSGMMPVGDQTYINYFNDITNGPFIGLVSFKNTGVISLAQMGPDMTLSAGQYSIGYNISYNTDR